MDEYLKTLIFKCRLESPGSWLMEALWLKRAAEEIDHWKHKNADINSPEGDFVFMIHVYKLLLGLSFENLLKGIVVAQSGPAGSAGVLDKKFKTHNVEKLLKRIDQTKVSISDSEKKRLIDLERYVKWAGRYPLPKKADDLFAIVDSYKEYQMRLSLWDRLFDYLKSIGWITKGDGRKLMMTR